jgi:sialidase-1
MRPHGRPCAAPLAFLALSWALLTGCGSGTDGSDVPPDGGPGAARPTAIALSEEARFTIVEGGSDHLAFPDVTRLSDGELLLVYRRGATHVDPSGRIMQQLGSPDGLTWTAATVLHDEPSIDDRDPSVTTLTTGEVLVSYFQYRTMAAAGTTLALHQSFVGRSTDQALSFSSFQQLGNGPMQVTSPTLVNDLWVDDQLQPIVVYACSSAIVETGGRLLLPAYGGAALNLDDLAAVPRSRVLLFATDLAAASWTLEPIAPEQATDTWLMEPALLQLAGGRLLLQIRTAAGANPSTPGNLLQAWSDDSGTSWSSYQDLGFVGHAPELLQLTNGVVLSAFRELNDAFSHEWTSLQWSLDDGVSWSERLQVRDCGAVECGYPALLELDDGRLLVVYYAPGGASIDAVIYRVDASYGPVTDAGA